ncbi:MAG TPA: YfiR family protein [Gemmatimonadales bacterium]|nr:YfiR family protein [Gemmatimonadales bacterium]
MALLSAMVAGASRSRGARRMAGAWIVASALVLCAGPGLSAQTARASEYQVKAVFLFNFAQFVDWPAEAFPGSDTPVVIGVLGDDPFGGVLDQTVRDERLRGRPFQVRRYQSVDEIKICHILFIGRSDADRPAGILAGLKHRPILTVSDADGFAERGGTIRFVTDRSRIRLQINLEAAEAAHLTISSKLLRLAEVITPAGH